MWHRNETGGLVAPSEVDLTSSKLYVYVRKNITFYPETGEGAETREAHFEWDEMKIPREMWAVCESVFGHDTALDDIYDALTELAEMIVGE